MSRWFFGRSGSTARRRGVRLAALPVAVGLLALGVVAVRGVVQQASAQAPAGAGTQIFVPATSAGPLREPPVIASRHGVLRATDTTIRAGIPGSGRPVCGEVCRRTPAR